MENQTNNPKHNLGKEQDNKASEQVENGHKSHNLEPNTDKDYMVLNKDGSLADLPEKEEDGSGALDGTVGLGT